MQNEWHAQVHDRSVFRLYVHQPSPVWRSSNLPAAANRVGGGVLQTGDGDGTTGYPLTRTILATEGTPRESNATR
jgi:hypothetical protein